MIFMWYIYIYASKRSQPANVCFPPVGFSQGLSRDSRITFKVGTWPTSARGWLVAEVSGVISPGNLGEIYTPGGLMAGTAKWWVCSVGEINPLILIMDPKFRKIGEHLLHPWKIKGCNIVMEVWKIMFLSKWVICRLTAKAPETRVLDQNVRILFQPSIFRGFCC